MAQEGFSFLQDETLKAARQMPKKIEVFIKLERRDSK